MAANRLSYADNRMVKIIYIFQFCILHYSIQINLIDIIMYNIGRYLLINLENNWKYV